MFNWVDVMRPFLFVPQGIAEAEPGRGAGLFMNPNVAASFIVMGTIAVLPFIPMRYRALILLAAVVGIAPTSSRSGYLYVSIAMIGAILLKLLNRAQAALIVIAVPLLVAGAAIYYDALMTASDVSRLDKIVMRLAWFEDPHEEDASVRARKAAAGRARDMFGERPLTGYGTGATSVAGVVDAPHNMYVMLMAEHGIIGLLLYVSLIGIMYRRGQRLARTATSREAHDVGKALVLYAAFISAYGLFSHNVLEEPFGIFVIAFLTAVAFRAAQAESVRAARPWSIQPSVSGAFKRGVAHRVRGDFPNRPQNGIHSRT